VRAVARAVVRAVVVALFWSRFVAPTSTVFPAAVVPVTLTAAPTEDRSAGAVIVSGVAPGGPLVM